MVFPPDDAPPTEAEVALLARVRDRLHAQAAWLRSPAPLPSPPPVAGEFET